MRITTPYFLQILLGAGSILASPYSPTFHTGLEERANGCANTATSRGCWGEHDISTNYYDEIFHTGVTREFWLEVVNTTLAPDGFLRPTMSFNGTLPGPAITADWGDDIVVHVTNTMANNGTVSQTVHFHGIRQLNTSEYDGVPGVTQCPIAPGDTFTYRFHASQYGTTWYHSHFSFQYSDGLVGPLTINGPASADYDYDLGHVFLSDWSHITADENWYSVDRAFGPEMENVLINFQNVYNCTDSTDLNCLGTGTRTEFSFESGKKYRFRVLNTATDGWFHFSIDNHTFTVIATDLVPIVPFETDTLQITVGQRYDIIVEANAATDNYWMRAGWVNYCATNYATDDDFAIIRYNNASSALPTSTGVTVPSSCADQDISLFTPYVAITVGAAASEEVLNVTYALVNELNTWDINNSTLYLNWSDPTTLMAIRGESIFPTDYNVYPITVVDDWVYWVIIDGSGFEVVYHPIHLHGHDFYVLAQVPSATFDPSTFVPNLNNPLRRDTASLPGGGYLVLAWKADNPGAWLMHCHLAWHASEGFALQFVEREDEIVASLTRASEWEDHCTKWDAYEAGEVWPQDDSGI